MNDLLQLMHDTMGKTANIKGSVALLKKDGISQDDADKLLDIIADQAKKLDEVIDAYYKKNKVPSKDQAVNDGFNIAQSGGYKRRMVLRDESKDLYYTGWMDCFDWVKKGCEE